MHQPDSHVLYQHQFPETFQRLVQLQLCGQCKQSGSRYQQQFNTTGYGSKEPFGQLDQCAQSSRKSSGASGSLWRDDPPARVQPRQPSLISPFPIWRDIQFIFIRWSVLNCSFQRLTFSEHSEISCVGCLLNNKLPFIILFCPLVGKFLLFIKVIFDIYKNKRSSIFTSYVRKSASPIDLVPWFSGTHSEYFILPCAYFQHYDLDVWGEKINCW